MNWLLLRLITDYYYPRPVRFSVEHRGLVHSSGRITFKIR